MATDIDLPAEALFTSDLSAFTHHTQASVQAAIRRAIRAHGGIRGCAGEVAAAYGEHPETAAPRMRWARAVAEDISVPAEHLAPPPPPGTTPPRPGSRLAVDPPAGASGPSRGRLAVGHPGLTRKEPGQTVSKRLTVTFRSDAPERPGQRRSAATGLTFADSLAAGESGDVSQPCADTPGLDRLAVRLGSSYLHIRDLYLRIGAPPLCG